MFIGVNVGWWSATKDYDNSAWIRGMQNNGNLFGRSIIEKNSGLSARCLKNDLDTPLEVLTGKIIEMKPYAVKIRGKVISGGGSEVILRGICWNKKGIPTVYDDSTTDGKGVGEFTGNLTGLEPKTIYYARAYAVNSQDTTYGEENIFTTIDSVIVITTDEITEVTYNSAKSGGEIMSDGGLEILSRGVCWNNTGIPTVNDSHTDDGNGIGKFISDIIGLETKTTYYVRAYAVNSRDTTYGEEKIFTTIDSALNETELQQLQKLITSLKAEGYQVDSTETGLYYIIEEDGVGEMAQLGDTLTIKYIGYFPNGNVFDTSSGINEDGTWEFVFEEETLIQGFEDGLKLMNTGMKIKMIIPSYLAYGSAGIGQIPPYSTLIFEVTMVEIRR